MGNLNVKWSNTYTFALLFWVGILSSCQKAVPPIAAPESNIPLVLTEQLAKFEKSDPDSAIQYSNLILEHIQENQLPDSLYIHYNGIKAEQLNKNTRQEEALNIFIENHIRAQNLGDSLLIAKTALTLGAFYNAISQYSIALPYLEFAVNYFQKKPVNESIATSLNSIGTAFLNEGNLYKALEYYKLVADFYSDQQDTVNIAYNLSDIGYTLIQLGLIEQALEATRRGLQLVASQSNHPSSGLTMGNLALNFRRSHPDSAIYYQEKALELTASSGDSIHWIINMFNLGNSLMELKRFDEAEKKFLFVLDICTEKNITQGINNANNALGSLYGKTGKFEKAIFRASLAHTGFQESGSVLKVISNLKVLINAYTQKGDWLQAQDFQKAMDSLQQDMQIQQTQTTTNYIQQAITAERFAFDNQMLEKRNKAAQQKIKARGIAITGLFLFFVAAFILWILWRREHLAAQEAIQVLLKRYASEIQSKKSEEVSLHEGDITFVQKAEQLRQLIDNDKIYLQPNIKAEDIMETLQISYKDLHQLVKSVFRLTLPQVLNHYRVQAAKEFLASEEHKQLSLDEIAILSGFGTRQNFHRAFQMQTGVTPGAFRDFIRKDKRGFRV